MNALNAELCCNCIPFLVLILSILLKRNNFKENFILESSKNMIKSPSLWQGSIKSFPFICSSTCLFVRLWCIFLSIYTVDFLFSFFIAWGYFAIYTKKVLIQILENCICYLDNWLNKTNLDQKQKMLHFYESSITFCALNGALNDFVKTACLWKIWFLRYRPKYSPPIRLQDFSNFDTSKTVWGIMLILCM